MDNTNIYCVFPIVFGFFGFPHAAIGGTNELRLEPVFEVSNVFVASIAGSPRFTGASEGFLFIDEKNQGVSRFDFAKKSVVLSAAFKGTRAFDVSGDGKIIVLGALREKLTPLLPGLVEKADYASVRCFSLPSGKIIGEFVGVEQAPKALNALTISPDNSLVAVAVDNPRLFLANISSGRGVWWKSGESLDMYDPCCWLKFTQSGGQLFAGGRVALRTVDARTGSRLPFAVENGYYNIAVTFRKNADVVAISASRDVPAIEGDLRPSANVKVFGNGELKRGVVEYSIRLYDLSGRKAEKNILSRDPIGPVAFSACGSQILAVTEASEIGGVSHGGGELVCWDISSLKEVGRWALSDPARILRVSDDGRLLLTSHHDGTVRVWRNPFRSAEK